MSDEDQRKTAIALLNGANVPITFGRYAAPRDTRPFVAEAKETKKLSKSIVLGSSTDAGLAGLGGLCKELVFAGVNLDCYSLSELFAYHEAKEFPYDQVTMRQACAIWSFCDRAESFYPPDFRMRVAGAIFRRLSYDKPVILNVTYKVGQDRSFMDQVEAGYGADLAMWLKTNAEIIRV